jgi:alkylhydroperoxidase family enzyme
MGTAGRREIDRRSTRSVSAWHECSCYTPRERAALLWAEAVTRLGDGHVSDDVWASDIGDHRRSSLRADRRQVQPAVRTAAEAIAAAVARDRLL